LANRKRHIGPKTIRKEKLFVIAKSRALYSHGNKTAIDSVRKLLQLLDGCPSENFNLSKKEQIVLDQQREKRRNVVYTKTEWQ